MTVGAATEQQVHEPGQESHRFGPPQFAAFDEPGYGKVATGFLVLPYGTGRSLLCTETRTATTDAAAACTPGR